MEEPDSKLDGSENGQRNLEVPRTLSGLTRLGAATVKAMFSAFGPLGGPIASGIDDAMAELQTRAYDRFFQEISQRIIALEISKERIAERLRSEDFIETYNRCRWIVLMTNRKTKIEAAAALVAEMMKPDSDDQRLSFNDTDFFVRCVDDLSTGALELLSEATAKSVGKRDNMNISFGSVARHVADDDLKMGLFYELARFNLVQISVPSVLHASNPYGNYGLRLTLMGKKLVDRILTDSKSLTEDLKRL